MLVSFLQVVLFIAVVGFICWAVSLISQVKPFQQIIIALGIVVCVIVAIYWVISIVGKGGAPPRLWGLAMALLT